MRPGHILLALVFLLPLVPADLKVQLGIPWTHDRLLAVLLAGSLLAEGLRKKFDRRVRLPLLGATLFLLAVQAWSLQQSVEPFGKRLFPLLSLAEQFLLLCACVNLGWGEQGRGFREAACRLLVLSATLAAAIGVFETLSGRTFLHADLVHLRGSFLRAQSTMLNPIRLGALLAMLLPVAVGQALRRQTRWAWLQTGVILLGALCSLSRSTYVALLFLGLAGPAWWQIGRWYRWKTVSRVLLPLLGAAAVAVGLALPGFVEHKSIVNATNRIYMARVALRMWAEHPLLGIGYQNFPRYAPLYHLYAAEPPTLALLDAVQMDPNPEFSPYLDLLPDRPPILGHPWCENSYLAVAAEMGTLGLVAYLWWTVLGLTMLWRCRGAQPREGYLLGCAVFHVVALFFDAHLAFILVYEYGVLLGLGLASCARRPGP